jgi:HSP20 family protein
MKTITKRNNYSIFNDFFNDEIFFPLKSNSPLTNLKETDSEYTVEVAAPGYKKDSFNIEIKNDYLIVSSKNKEEKEEKNEKYYKKEFAYSSFKRSFLLPENVDENDIKASYNEGILNISIPKKEKVEKAKRLIEIE